jgi:hypothetical protein
MTAIRLYLAALMVSFSVALVITTTIGVLEATVMTAAPLLLILDMNEELKALRLLEEQVATLDPEPPL